MTSPVDGAPGDRVVVRFAKGDGAPGDWRRDPSATRTDVTGVLVSADDTAIVVRRDGEEVSIPAALVLSVRVLPDRAVRTSEIRELETAAAHGWPGTDRETVDGWLLRAGGGWSRRANSAVPLAFGVTADVATLSVIRRWYDDHGLPTTIAAVDRVLPAGAVPDGVRVAVMTRDILSVRPDPAVFVDVSTTPTDDWLAAVIGHRDEVVDPAVAADVLSAVVDGTLLFASVTVDGTLVATGRGAITRSTEAAPTWLGLSCLRTHPDHRGHGVGTAVVTALMQDARKTGCERAYLQVEQDNAAAIRLYRRLGFVRHHGYGYLTL
ncbi:N-acetylglutamate synthase, CG3035 family [Williamsia deligens]|uniref:GNAT family N-acetyltransferase n=1 Tax=Williamsia deligens TaxID=321325 RepID=A0ABW3G5X3_9NOCA|nr:GNAT family N-acetyltransferase [Williamsia deligens]MCP2193176.1 Acetyltransferase (GNAT) family protein [Williamsia deligens]